MRFPCPYCGADAYYYGFGLAICSSGARLLPADIPAELVLQSVWAFREESPVTAMGIMSAGPSVVNSNPLTEPNNPVLNLFNRGLLNR